MFAGLESGFLNRARLRMADNGILCLTLKKSIKLTENDKSWPGTLINGKVLFED